MTHHIQPLHQAKILLIEDSHVIAKMAIKKLKGYEVTWVKNSNEALSILSSNCMQKFALTLCDNSLGCTYSGSELVRFRRAFERTHHKPRAKILLCSTDENIDLFHFDGLSIPKNFSLHHISSIV